MKKCRIAIDTSPLSRDVRGIGVFVQGFLSHLAEITASLFEIRLISLKDQSFDFPFSRVNRRDLDRSWLVWFPWNHPTFPAPGKFLVTIHDLAPFVFPQGERKLQKQYEKGADQAEKIVADSEFTRQEIKKFLKIPDSKIVVISPGFERSEALIDSFSPPWPYILALGPAEPRKNFFRLIQAFSLIKQQRIPHKLVILGELPPERKKIAFFMTESANSLPRFAKVSGLEKEIFFPGFVPKFMVSRWLQSASAVVVPSLYEGFGYPVLEAYSFGVPLACSRAASLPEVAGNAAFYFDPWNVEEMAQTLLQTLREKILVERKKEEAVHQISCFSWKTCVEKYASLFLEIAGYLEGEISIT